MKLLALDSSCENISLCAANADGILFNLNRRIRFGASQLIVYMQKYLKKINKKINYFDALVVGSGPGSFTGLRISFSLIKAFSLATGIPVVSLSSFLSCAEQLKSKSHYISVVTDARKDLLYRADFKIKNGLVKAKGRTRLVSLDKIENISDTLFVTYDKHLRKQLPKLYPDIEFYPKDIYPKAYYLLAFAGERVKKKKFTSLDKLLPLYIHPKTCQIRKRG
ncbi:MAG: tRNA (adenosine(37)-N6)-threonylcarbamoyltransferase complex dimerization subunit type 1 TsaB [Candidatus Omnitrophica bacterium]|nr:tRNA (adenosine(37)-N6)-threonylcarbamoyltransferase complex dimerization subunit type 1 TsaB [Candidatus Omnitrophota bacterium]